MVMAGLEITNVYRRAMESALPVLDRIESRAGRAAAARLRRAIEQKHPLRI
jgi:hypothetical protein